MIRATKVPKVTVIMPSLNVAKYIRTCMQSVLMQTLQEIEILAIDAGSNDGTLEILQEYAAMDARVKVIVSEKKSYGYQINLGIIHAQGKYIGIVETDDKISPGMYEILYQTAEQTRAEYVKGRAEFYVDLGRGKEWSTPIRLPLKDKSLIGQAIAPCKCPDLLVNDIYLWNGIYEREFLQDVRLNETMGAAFQDQGFLLQTISRAKRAVYLNKIVYSYRQNNANSSIFNKKGFHYLVEEYALNKKYLSDMNDAWTKAYYMRMLNQSNGRFETMANSSCFWEEAVSDMDILCNQLHEAVEKNILTQEDVEAERWEMLQTWFINNEAVYEKCRDKIRAGMENIQSILHKVKGHSVIIVGCGKWGRFVHILLENTCGDIVQAFVDNDSKLWSRTIQGVTVSSPEVAVKIYPEAIYVIANKKHAEPIKQQLIQLGINEIKICQYTAGVQLSLLQFKKAS